MADLTSRNPATSQTVGSVAITELSEIESSVAAARAAQPAWAGLPVEERASILLEAGAILEERADEIGRLATQEMGKPLRQARGEARHAASTFPRTVEEIVAALRPTVLESDSVRSTVYRDPYGVVACIAPWNFPVLMPHQQILPALAAGNAVVFKPSEHTPLTGQAYADALMEVLPAGVLQVVHGADAQGVALVAADVDLIVFTGSAEAGKHIVASASKALKRVILELGGKDPLIVLDDADVANAARFATRNSFGNAGQVCISTERIYALPSVAGELLDAVIDNARALTVGDGMDEATDVGPMVSEEQRDHVLAQVREAVADGARIAWRGEAPSGNFIAPIVLADVTHDMRIAREETFGPVACFVAVTDEEDAIRKANDSPFGLGAVVYGESARARRVARRLNAGMVGVNQGLSHAPGAPWVGARESGYGFHSGPDGHRQFTQARVVSEPRD
ncbi:MAG: aldehyde dehydrogenase family protein [Myxococcota bacterium]